MVLLASGAALIAAEPPWPRGGPTVGQSVYLAGAMMAVPSG